MNNKERRESKLYITRKFVGRVGALSADSSRLYSAYRWR
jgi:hypothetical protein